MSNCTSERIDAEKAPSADVSVGRPLVSVGATAVICFCVSAYLLAVPIFRSWICVLSACTCSSSALIFASVSASAAAAGIAIRVDSPPSHAANTNGPVRKSNGLSIA